MMKIAETVIHQVHVQLRHRVMPREKAVHFTKTVKTVSGEGGKTDSYLAGNGQRSILSE